VVIEMFSPQLTLWLEKASESAAILRFGTGLAIRESFGVGMVRY